MAEERGAAHAFSRTFNKFQSMREELAQLEASRRGVSERLLRTQTSEQSRRPSVQVVEAATVPREAWRPDYSRDAAISAAMALAFGLLAMALVELFNQPPRPSTAPVIVPQPWIALRSVRELSPPLPGMAAPLHLPRQAAALPLPAADTESPRELSQAEVTSLLRATQAEDLAWVGLLLCGATQEEIRPIAKSDLEIKDSSIRLRGPSERSLRVAPAVFRRILAKADRRSEAVIDMPDSEDEQIRRLICAGHDAGLDDPARITPQALRHTCIAYLVRQGLRFGELDRVVGALPAKALARYAGLSPPVVRLALAQVDPVMPALKALDSA